MWNGWVVVDWGPSGHSVCEIWCFVGLRGLPEDFSADIGGVIVQKGVYAVVGSAKESEEEEVDNSDLSTPIYKECERENGVFSKRKFYLADVGAFASPVAVVADVGAPNRWKYFRLTPRREWPKMFIKWLQADHKIGGAGAED